MEAKVNNLRNGDEKAFKTLYNEFFKSACIFASRYIYSETAAIDIVQEVFVNIWEKREIFISFKFFKAYLYKSVKNGCLKYIRNKQVEQKYINQLNVSEEGEDFLKAILVEEVQREIISVVHGLPSERRKIILLVLKGLKNDEIAEELGVSVNTVKTQKRKAYAFLREELKDIFAVFVIVDLL